MPISAAVSFGSFGDIVTIIQLVVQLTDALSDITGTPSEIEALVDDLNGYMLVLPLMERVLLCPDSHFDPDTRSRVEERLKRCKDTLLAIQHQVNAFAARVQPRAGLRILRVYTVAVRWRLFGGRKQVAALHARLDKQLSLMQMCLGISQSNGQHALHEVAERTGMSTEQLVLMMQARPGQVAVGATVLQMQDYRTGTVYQAFAVVPLRLLRAYLEPLIVLTGKGKGKLYMFGSENGITFRRKGLWETLKLDWTYNIVIRSDCADPRPFWHAIIFNCQVFVSGSGERHALIGIPPSERQDLASCVLYDALNGSLDDAESYPEQKSEAHLSQTLMRYYVQLLRTASRHSPLLPFYTSLFEGFFILRFLAQARRLFHARYGRVTRKRQLWEVIDGAVGDWDNKLYQKAMGAVFNSLRDTVHPSITDPVSVIFLMAANSKHQTLEVL